MKNMTPRTCDSCGKTQHVMNHPTRNEDLCPACAHRNAEWDTAQKHLTALLEPVITAWANHWLYAGLTVKALAPIAASINELTEGPREWVESLEVNT
jgi:hypothetical protein